MPPYENVENTGIQNPNPVTLPEVPIKIVILGERYAEVSGFPSTHTIYLVRATKHNNVLLYPRADNPTKPWVPLTDAMTQTTDVYAIVEREWKVDPKLSEIKISVEYPCEASIEGEMRGTVSIPEGEALYTKFELSDIIQMFERVEYEPQTVFGEVAQQFNQPITFTANGKTYCARFPYSSTTVHATVSARVATPLGYYEGEALLDIIVYDYSAL